MYRLRQQRPSADLGPSGLCKQQSPRNSGRRSPGARADESDSCRLPPSGMSKTQRGARLLLTLAALRLRSTCGTAVDCFHGGRAALLSQRSICWPKAGRLLWDLILADNAFSLNFRSLRSFWTRCTIRPLAAATSACRWSSPATGLVVPTSPTLARFRFPSDALLRVPRRLPGPHGRKPAPAKRAPPHGMPTCGSNLVIDLVAANPHRSARQAAPRAIGAHPVLAAAPIYASKNRAI